MAMDTSIAAALAAVLGLLVGSFLNVVIYRLPKMMERAWAAECAQLTGAPAPSAEPFNLAVPRSACPHCGDVIRWYENIPVLSYLALRGRCSQCHTHISLRYPLVELAVSAVFAGCLWRWGLTPTAAAWIFFATVLLAAALIDWDTTFLPDSLTLPLLWAGLIASDLGWIDLTLHDAVWGAAAGYASLWLVYWSFKLVTGKEGMGFGDFKLFAALGAWFGWQALVPMILMASIIGALVGIALKLNSGLREGGYVPFGPFLAGAGLTAMVFGPQSILRALGL